MSKRALKHRGLRPRPSGRAGEGPNVLWIVALGLLCAAVAGGLVYIKLTAKTPPKLVAETLCPVEGPQAVFEVLIDASDDIPALAKKEIVGKLHDLVDGLPEYGRLELRILSPQEPGGHVVFDKCNPGNGSNLNGLVANPEMAKRRWMDGFAKPLDDALTAQLGPAKSDISPIMETIQNIAVDRFIGNSASAIPKRLVIVSDMIEHEADYSQYRGDLSYARFKASPGYKRLKTDLNQAEVSIFYLQRQNSHIDSAKHIAFWTDWITDNDGRLASAEKLQGAG